MNNDLIVNYLTQNAPKNIGALRAAPGSSKLIPYQLARRVVSRLAPSESERESKLCSLE
jgi:hypothetical protein